MEYKAHEEEEEEEEEGLWKRPARRASILSQNALWSRGNERERSKREREVREREREVSEREK